MAAQDDWSSEANAAVDISLLEAGDQLIRPLSTFHPDFTYPIFGTEERIFGYKNLRIRLRFAANDLYPNVSIDYDAKFKAVEDAKPTEIAKILKEFLPSYAFEKSATFESRLRDKPSVDFQPPGQLILEYSRAGRDYQIWCGELTDPAVQLLLERMQIFISFFIEGGTPLVLDDQEWTLARWRVFFVYERIPSSKCQYSIVGYSTSYRFLTYQHTPISSKSNKPFKFPPDTPISVSSLPSRSRISQFLILPPHQSNSHGTRLYNAMIATFLADRACMEITVEDPNESFDDLRDFCDYKRLQNELKFSSLKLNTDLEPKATIRRIGVRVPTSRIIDKSLLKTLRQKTKLAPRQFDRLVELHLLSQIPVHNRQSGTARLTQKAKSTDVGDRMFYYWRLLVKQRVYKQNRDVLIQFDRTERIDKVEQTVGEVAGDYERLLRAMSGAGGEGGEENGEQKERGQRESKRKVIEDDDDDDGDNDNKRRGKKRAKGEDG